jgi:hypothetical protein
MVIAKVGTSVLPTRLVEIDKTALRASGMTDTYIVTLNNASGGTAYVTTVVSNGSVRIDSIVVTSALSRRRATSASRAWRGWDRRWPAATPTPMPSAIGARLEFPRANDRNNTR